jgi:hypothetical protein
MLSRVSRAQDDMVVGLAVDAVGVRRGDAIAIGGCGYVVWVQFGRKSSRCSGIGIAIEIVEIQ